MSGWTSGWTLCMWTTFLAPAVRCLWDVYVVRCAVRCWAIKRPVFSEETTCTVQTTGTRQISLQDVWPFPFSCHPLQYSIYQLPHRAIEGRLSFSCQARRWPWPRSRRQIHCNRRRLLRRLSKCVFRDVGGPAGHPVETIDEDLRRGRAVEEGANVGIKNIGNCKVTFIGPENAGD